MSDKQSEYLLFVEIQNNRSNLNTRSKDNAHRAGKANDAPTASKELADYLQ